jgi:hypothetical protein
VELKQWQLLLRPHAHARTCGHLMSRSLLLLCAVRVAETKQAWPHEAAAHHLAESAASRAHGTHVARFLAVDNVCGCSEPNTLC